ncbi:MAG: CDP-alcohol phosphatidyltransferase family protein [Rubrimonas sp.]
MVAQSPGVAGRPGPHRIRPPRFWRAPLPPAVACVAATAAASAALADALWGGQAPVAGPIAAGATALGGAGMLLGLARAYPHDRFGLCNAITLARGGLVAALMALAAAPGLLAQSAVAWQAVGVALAALALDGLDGLAARRSGLASAFGARFDMEVDTALALLLAVLVALSGKVGPWVLALGLMRPAFVVAGLALPWLRRPLPPALWRKTVCVAQIGALIALLSPLAQPPAASAIAALALVPLAAGFARDVVWLRRRA